MDVTIVEVSPRDGLQNEAVVLPTEVKVELITRLVAAGARRVEAVSFAHPRLVPAMADAEAVMERVPRADGVSYAGLAVAGQPVAAVVLAVGGLVTSVLNDRQERRAGPDVRRR